MVKVCEEWFPKGSFPYQSSDGFYMHEVLKMQIDYFIQNVVKDWDFTIIISGEGEVRVGKSVLAMQIGCYWTYMMEKIYGFKCPFDVKNNFVFKGAELIKRGNILGTNYPYSCLIFDEAGADLESTKTMKATTQAVRDYLRECGQYNMLNLLVLPEYFDLPKGIAISRSACLINVYYLVDQDGFFDRGYFKFYSRPLKKYLYLNGKKYLDYDAGKYDFYGNFKNIYTVDQEEYRTAKKIALKQRENISAKELRREQWLIGVIKYFQDQGFSLREIADLINQRSRIKISHMTIQALLKGENIDLIDDP